MCQGNGLTEPIHSLNGPGGNCNKVLSMNNLGGTNGRGGWGRVEGSLIGFFGCIADRKGIT